MFKAVPLVDVKAGPDDGLGEGVFTGYASVFDVKDSYGDVVRKGAFTDTLAEWEATGNTLPVLYGHDMADPFSNIGGVLTAEEDDRGLKITAQLDLDDAKAAKVFKLLKGRRLNQMSFAYDVMEGGPAKSEEFGDYYELNRLKLYEVSVVPIGANQQTEILAVKHLADAVKAGRVFSAANEKAIADIADQMIDGGKQLKSVLAAASGEGKAAPAADHDQEKASGEPEAKSGATDEEPPAAKSSVPDEEPKAGPSVIDLAATELSLLALGTEGESEDPQ